MSVAIAWHLAWLSAAAVMALSWAQSAPRCCPTPRCQGRRQRRRGRARHGGLLLSGGSGTLWPWLPRPASYWHRWRHRCGRRLRLACLPGLRAAEAIAQLEPPLAAALLRPRSMPSCVHAPSGRHPGGSIFAVGLPPWRLLACVLVRACQAGLYREPRGAVLLAGTQPALAGAHPAAAAGGAVRWGGCRPANQHGHVPAWPSCWLSTPCWLPSSRPGLMGCAD